MDAVNGLPNCGHKCGFINKPDDNYYCNGCKNVARKPTITSCCGRCFCAEYIEPVKEKGEPCPRCGKMIAQTMIQSLYEEEISSMMVKCTNVAKGCKWECPLVELEDHLDESKDECMYVEVPCHKGCGSNIEKGSVEIHLNNDCAERQFTCQYCNKQGTYRCISQEHWPECAYKPVQCPNLCGVTCEQSMLEVHCQTCTLSTIQCFYWPAGCKTTFQRKDEDDHMKEKLQHHLDLIMKMCQGMTEKCQETKTLCERRLEEQAQEFSDKLRAFETEHAEASKCHEEKLQAVYRECENKLCTMKQRFDMVLRGKDESIKTLKENIKSTIDACVKKSIESFQLKTGVLPYAFTMGNYKQLKVNNDIWYSPDMVTHLEGYTFLITVRPNGHDDSLNKGIGVWLRCVKGLTDHSLKWPVKVTITLELLNQQGDHDHVTMTKSFELQRISDPEWRHNCIDAFSYSYILHAYLNYNEVKKTQYLKDDCLKFRLTRIKVH